MNIREELFKLQDEKYREFNGKLVPNVKLIGIRIPNLRKLAKKIVKEEPEKAEIFLNDLPHEYLEENLLHSFILEQEKNLNRLMKKTEEFLPYIDNWQVCDSFVPNIFKKNDDIMAETIEKWLSDSKDFTIRYGIRLLIARKDYHNNNIVNVIKAGDNPAYYVYMAAAWYLSMAAKANPEGVLFCFNQLKPGNQLVSSTVRKIRESKQFTAEEKEFFSKELK